MRALWLPYVVGDLATARSFYTTRLGLSEVDSWRTGSEHGSVLRAAEDERDNVEFVTVDGRVAAFTVLVLAQLFNCFNARSDNTSAFRHLFVNPWLWGAVALSAAPKVTRTGPGVAIFAVWCSTLSRPSSRTGTTGTPSLAPIMPMPGRNGLISPAIVRLPSG